MTLSLSSGCLPSWRGSWCGAEVVPGPAVEAPFLDVRDVVGHEVVAERVALVDRRPELARLRVGRQADGVADARGEDPLVLAVGVEREDVGPALLRVVVADVRPRADRDEERLAVGREFQVARPVAAAADALVAAGDVLDDRLGGPGGLGVAVLVGEADDRVGVADVNVIRLRPGRIEGDPERALQSGGEDLVHLGLAVAVGVAQGRERGWRGSRRRRDRRWGRGR